MTPLYDALISFDDATLAYDGDAYVPVDYLTGALTLAPALAGDLRLAAALGGDLRLAAALGGDLDLRPRT